MIEIRLMGRFSVRRDGEEIPPTAFAGRLTRTLVRLLSVRRGEFVSHDVLADALWATRLPADPVANLQVLVNRARRALGDPALIETGPGGYTFPHGRGCVVDAEQFTALVAKARQHLAEARAGAGLRDVLGALEMWGDPLPEDAYDDWAQPFRETLVRRRLEALETGAHAALAVRDPAQAVALAGQAVAAEPLRESASLLLARALAATGEAAAALQSIDKLRRALADEMGLEPSADIADLERAILSGEAIEPALRSPSRAAAPRSFAELPFVGRDHELETMQALSGRGSPAVVLVSGSAGTGKSRLLAEAAARSSLSVVTTRAFLPEREEAWSLARSLLRETASFDLQAIRDLPARVAGALAWLLPEMDELREVDSSVVDAESRRALTMEASIRIFGGVAEKGLLVMADDLQWADASSLSVLQLMVARLPKVRAVFAYRPEEVEVDSPLAAFLSEMRAHGERAVPLTLLPLGADALSELVADDALVQTIVRDTDATAMTVSEVLRALEGRQAIERELDGRWRLSGDRALAIAEELAGAGQRRSILARAARQRPAPRHLLSLLSLLGRESPARLLATAAGMEQGPVLDHLDTLARSGLARFGDGGWATAHDVVGETVAAGLDPSERGRLHECLARALEAEHGDHAEIARHLAGAGDKPAAAAAYARAARDRLERFAAPEAIRLAEAGLDLDPAPDLRASLLDSRGEGRAVAGDLSGARADLRTALPAKQPGPKRALALARLAMLSLADDPAQAGELIEMAIIEAGDDPAARAEAMTVAAFVGINTGRFDRVDERVAEARTLYTRLGDGRGAARLIDAQAHQAMWFRGELPEAMELYGRAARLYLDSGNLLLAGMPLALSGFALVYMGRAEEALPLLDEGLELERTLGQAEGEAFCQIFRADALGALGRLEEARALVSAARESCQTLGLRPWAAAALYVLSTIEEASGDSEAAERASRTAAEESSDIPLMHGLATARWASMLLARDKVAEAEATARKALHQAVGKYEAELVLAAVALRRGDADADAMVAEALARAERGGFCSTPIFRRLQAHAAAAMPSGPAGRARTRRTFMFTDIVSSTNLVETLGDEAWDLLLRWHDETLRSLFRSHGGEEVNRIGDGFFIAFSEPHPAVDCAVAIQRALLRHRREHGFSPQVRIGLHEAEATRHGHDYQGKGVHVAARIGAVARGGEIVASASLAEQLQELAVVDPRAVSLKGLSEPVPVVTIAWQ